MSYHYQFLPVSILNTLIMFSPFYYEVVQYVRSVLAAVDSGFMGLSTRRVLPSPVYAGLHPWRPIILWFPYFLTRVYVCAQGPSSHGQRVHEGPQPAADDVLPSPVPAGLRSGNAFRSASPRLLSRLSTWWVIFMADFGLYIFITS